MMTSPPTHLFHPLPNPSPQNDNGLAISQLFKQGGPGTTVLLVPRTTYPLYSAIDFSHHSTNLATQGFPTFDSGNQAILETRGEKEAGAVKMFNLPRTTLKRVHLRGCRGWGATPPKEDEEKERLKRQGKMGWLEGGGALVWMGGPEAYESCVEGCRIEDPRGWTGLHLVDYAQKCQVLDNIVGPCGQQAPGGPWADGLSIAGKDSLIAGNTVFDATDGAIVIFCAPGSIVTRNTIIARERNLLGAINMVDDFPFDRNFEGTKVIGNLIKTEGAFIRLAIGCGPTCWSPWGPGHTLNHGGAVLDNYLGPGQFGYGIALSGARRFKVLGNRVLPSTRFAGSTHRFYPATVNAPPTAFLTQWCDRGRVQECEIQDDFVEGEAQWLIGIEPEMGDKLEYEAGQVKLDEKGMSRAGEGGLALRDGRWEVTEHGELILRRVDKGQHLDQFGMGRYGEGQVIWTSGGGGKVQDPILEFRTDGALTLRSHGGTGEALWDPVSYLSRYLPAPPHVPNPSDPSPPETWVSRAKLILQAKKPYLQIKNHQGNLVFSSSYDWTNQDGWIMAQGQWLAIAPAEIRGYEDSSSSVPQTPNNGSPQIPPRPGHEGGNHSGGGGGGRFGRFVKDVSASLQERGVEMPSFVQQSFPNMSTPHDRPQPPSGGAPAVPPRPGGRPNSSATFLYFSPETCQLILHSSPAGPTSPDPQHTHWAVPSTPVSPPPKEGSFVSFQGDGNVVMYAGGGVPWASMTNGERCADRLVLKANGEEGGPAFELRAKDGSLIFTSKQ